MNSRPPLSLYCCVALCVIMKSGDYENDIISFDPLSPRNTTIEFMFFIIHLPSRCSPILCADNSFKFQINARGAFSWLHLLVTLNWKLWSRTNPVCPSSALVVFLFLQAGNRYRSGRLIASCRSTKMTDSERDEEVDLTHCGVWLSFQSISNNSRRYVGNDSRIISRP